VVCSYWTFSRRSFWSAEFENKAMMQGRVNQRCEATLALAVKGSEITQMVDTVIDTGFSGFLTSWTRCSSTTEV
jgi:hypothetical protein